MLACDTLDYNIELSFLFKAWKYIVKFRCSQILTLVAVSFNDVFRFERKYNFFFNMKIWNFNIILNYLCFYSYSCVSYIGIVISIQIFHSSKFEI